MSNTTTWSAPLQEVLVECPLFAGIRAAEIVDLLDRTSSRLLNYEKGSMIAQSGDSVHFLHIMVKGSVKGEMIDFAGKVIKIEDILPPWPLATAFLFGKQNHYPVNITANEDCSILAIPRDDVLLMMQMNQVLLRNFLNAVSSRSQFLSSKIRFLSFGTIREKLAQYFLEISGETEGVEFRIPHSQNQLSELFGVARPSVGRAISEMNQEGLIRTEGKQHTIMNLRELKALLAN